MTDDLLISSSAIRKYLIGRAFIRMMTRTQSTMLPLLALSAMSSTNFTSIIKYTVNGSVYDEHGAPVGSADVLVKSTAELKKTVTSSEGSFTADILISGILDPIFVSATSGDLHGSSWIQAQGSLATVMVILE